MEWDLEQIEALDGYNGYKLVKDPVTGHVELVNNEVIHIMENKIIILDILEIKIEIEVLRITYNEAKATIPNKGHFNRINVGLLDLVADIHNDLIDFCRILDDRNTALIESDEIANKYIKEYNGIRFLTVKDIPSPEAISSSGLEPGNVINICVLRGINSLNDEEFKCYRFVQEIIDENNQSIVDEFINILRIRSIVSKSPYKVAF